MQVANDKDDPNKNIGDNSRREILCSHCDSSVPEQSGNGPGIGARNSRQMDEGGSNSVVPVGGRLGKQMGDQDDLSWPEKIANPEHDESKDEEVIQDEMASNIGGRRNEDVIAGEEVPNIADLGKKQQDPAKGLVLNSIRPLKRFRAWAKVQSIYVVESHTSKFQ